MNRDYRPMIMGILNVTPDSFSDGGRYHDQGTALAHALIMAEHGADIIDVGGESTRPGAGRISAPEQIKRVIPVIEGLRRQLPAGVVISIDTTRAGVAERALAAGAAMINDVSAGGEDPDMLKLAARARVPIVLMHMLGNPGTMQDHPCYRDVVAEIRDYLVDRAGAARAAGIDAGNIYLDPGIGFGKTLEHNLALLANLEDFSALPYPVVLGASRKSTLAALCPVADRRELVGATCATTTVGVLAGIRCFRVHDVRENRQAADVAWALRQRLSGHDGSAGTVQEPE